MKGRVFQLESPFDRIKVYGEIRPEQCEDVLALIDAAERHRIDPLVVEIRSEGGDADTAMRIGKRLRECTITTKGVVTQRASSAASLILQGCSERVMYRDAKLQIHFFSKMISAVVAYDKETLERCIQSFRQKQDEMIDWYAQASHLPKETILDLLREGDMGFRMSAKEALDHGLIDRIASM